MSSGSTRYLYLYGYGTTTEQRKHKNRRRKKKKKKKKIYNNTHRYEHQNMLNECTGLQKKIQKDYKNNKEAAALILSQILLCVL